MYFPSLNLNEIKHDFTSSFHKNKYDIFSKLRDIKQILFLPTRTSLQKGEKEWAFIRRIKKKQLIPNEIKTALNSYDRIPSHLTDIPSRVYDPTCTYYRAHVSGKRRKKEKKKEKKHLQRLRAAR